MLQKLEKNVCQRKKQEKVKKTSKKLKNPKKTFAKIVVDVVFYNVLRKKFHLFGYRRIQ